MKMPLSIRAMSPRARRRMLGSQPPRRGAKTQREANVLLRDDWFLTTMAHRKNRPMYNQPMTTMERAAFKLYVMAEHRGIPLELEAIDDAIVYRHATLRRDYTEAEEQLLEALADEAVLRAQDQEPPYRVPPMREEDWQQLDDQVIDAQARVDAYNAAKRKAD